MNIDEIVFSTPIPIDEKFLNSTAFLHVLVAKHLGLQSLILNSNDIGSIVPLINELKNLEGLISHTKNLMFLRYLIGTKYIEIGQKFDNDDYLVKGIAMMEKIHEDELPGTDLIAGYYRLFYRGILIHFNNDLKRNHNYQYSFRNVEPLLKSKYFLFKLYTLLIEKKIELNALIEQRVISDLISVLIFLSRWSEPFFILDKRTIIYKASPAFFNYLKARILNDMTFHTCCSIYPAMAFEIKAFIQKATNIKEENDDWRTDLLSINEDVDKTIKSYGINLEDFEKGYVDPEKNLEEHKPYRKWVLKNHFSLCEHALYCFCGLSSTDDLKIKSDHEHTQIQWVEQFDILLEKIKGDFNLTRYFLFISENDSKLNYIRDEEIKDYCINESIINNSNSDYLIQAFKCAYSILDKIGRAIYLALEIKQKDIYFHNCWKKIKETNLGDHNRYLIALYSIACDLSDTSKYSAFKEYKDWRNLIEHEFFFLIKEDANIEAIKQEFAVIKGFVKIDEFKEKTHYMLQLCRSAIFCFVFFIRHESKKKEIKPSDNCLYDKIMK